MVLMAPVAGAHTVMMTQVLVSFTKPGTLDVKIDVDLTLLLGTPDRYYELATAPLQRQQEDVKVLAPQVTDNLQLFVGQQRLRLEFRGFTAAKAQKADYLDASMSKLSRFDFVAALPASGEPLRLVVPLGAQVDYPVAYTVQIPARHSSVTRWLEEGVHESEPFVWVDELGKTSQLVLYLRLGFRHIVPEGTDHILFVLGLFFLGITWRKLLSQTTVFTVAHATTLFLSTYGIFRLPSQLVEPAIAASIAYIAVENVVKSTLGIGRLAIVFGFGLLHGLGFASSLSDIPFPKRDFVVALLGFNFGVDFGQLCVIGLAFLAVGGLRNKPWFRPRIAVPCSLAIAAVGLLWAIQRIIYYGTHA